MDEWSGCPESGYYDTPTNLHMDATGQLPSSRRMSPVALAHRRSFASKAAAFSRTRSPPSTPCSPPAAWRSRLTPRSPSCAWSTPDPHGLRNQVVGGGHGRDRALLLQDLANNPLLELIGVFGSGHELTPHLSREETLPKSRGPRSLQCFSSCGFLVVSGWVFPVVQFMFDLTPNAVVEHRVESDWTFLTKATSPREPPPVPASIRAVVRCTASRQIK